MGKQSRRNRSRNKQGNKHGGKQGDKQDDRTSSSSTLVQRIRHADPRTRHAALAALNSTFLDPEELKKQKTRVISPQVLQAVRERVMDSDLECAQVAAGCLANFVSFGNHRKQDGIITSGWTVVFMERLKQCRQALSASEKKNRKQWLALTAQCQHALCALVETTLEHVPDLVDTMLGLFDIGRHDLDARANVAAAVDQELEYAQDITVYATRTLHSSLDDNMELLRLVTTEGWDTLHSGCSQANLPLAARLHAAGCLVAARQLLGDPFGVFHGRVVSTVIPLLHQTLESVPVNAALVENYAKAQEQWEDQEADDAMERDVIQSVNDRKESAQAIAKRLKEEKRELNDEDMEHDTPDARQVLEQARKAWHAAVSPLQLALEIVANLTSVNSEPADVPMDEWEQDTTVDQSPLDASLQEALVQSGLSDRLVILLKALCVELSSDVPADAKDDIEDLQSKCAACLGNCLQNLSSWHNCNWKDLQSTAEFAQGRGLEGVFDAMAVAMRARREWRKQIIRQEDLDFLLKSLTSNESITIDVVCMLGLLCSSEPHPSTVNEKVCAGLLSLPCESPRVMSEVFNALMDMYGDDGHTIVFESLDVLGYFQRLLPLFNKRIQAEQAAMEDDVERWRETALNSSRFISYKKGHL